MSMGDEADRIIDDGIQSLVHRDEDYEMAYRPRNNTLRNVVQYLESIGLEIMGPGVDLTTGEQFAANRNFNVVEVITYRRMYENDEFWWSEGE